MNVNNISPPAKRIGSSVTLADCEKRVRFKEPKGDPATPESMIEKYVQASFATITKEKQWVDKEIKGKYPHQFLCSIVRGEYNEQLDGMTLKKIIEALQARGAEINATGNDGKTALHVAAKYGQVEAIKVLVGLDADINATGNDGWTTLHYAARYGEVEAITVLIENGAEINATDDDGKTALQVASGYGHSEAIRILHLFAELSTDI